MFFDQVHIISKNIEPVPLADVEKLETELGVKMLSGYAPFITRFGEGVYCDLFQIFAPKHILEDYKKYREGWDNFYYRDTEEKLHWFFEGSEHILSEAQVQESI